MGKCILIVDDDLISRVMLRKTMEQLDFEVFEADNGEIALEIIENNEKIVLVSLDLNMPIMDGYTFLSEINKSDLKSRLKIFVTSCYSRKDFLKATLENDIDTTAVKNYFEKPFLMESFSETMLSYTA
jgi:CheY-like chemotaxis protein